MQASISWLTDPTVYAVNRLPAHSDHRFYRSLPELASGASSLVQSLDGLWRFAYSSCPAQRPENFWQTGADLSGFGSIRVPGHIELQGYGQRRYVNAQYPWDGHKEIHPPEIDWDDRITRDALPSGLASRLMLDSPDKKAEMVIEYNRFVGALEDAAPAIPEVGDDGEED